MRNRSKSIAGISLAAIVLLQGGCASEGVRNPSGVPVTEMTPDERGFVAGLGMESQDLVTVTDRMAREILGIPEIAQATRIPRVILQPVRNETRFPINKEIFLARIRGRLNTQARNKVRFLARDSMPTLERELELKRTGQVAAQGESDEVQFRTADFVLTGTLQGLSTRTSQGMSDYILYSFQLIDARTSDIVYEGQAEMKKQGLEDAVYR